MHAARRQLCRTSSSCVAGAVTWTPPGGLLPAMVLTQRTAMRSARGRPGCACWASGAACREEPRPPLRGCVLLLRLAALGVLCYTGSGLLPRCWARLTAGLCSLLLLGWAPCCCWGVQSFVVGVGMRIWTCIPTDQHPVGVGVGGGALVLQSTAACSSSAAVQAACGGGCRSWHPAVSGRGAVCTHSRAARSPLFAGGLQRAVPGVGTRACCSSSSGRSGGRQPVRAAFCRQEHAKTGCTATEALLCVH